MYNEQTEKRLVASFLTTAKVRDGMAIISDNDIVAIPEGSSGTYVGLGIAARATSEARIVTSNAGLIREYRDNPMLAPRFREFRVIGGLADGEHGTVHERAEQQFIDAIGHDPGATIVIMTVSGLLPQSGPHVSGPGLRVKQTMIRKSLECGVREIVFVADYSKHMATAANSGCGAPVFGATEWRDTVDRHRSRICIVTAPPPALCGALKLGLGHDVVNRNLDVIASDPKFTAAGLAFEAKDRAYHQAAKELWKVAGVSTHGGQPQSMFHEAYTFPPSFRSSVEPRGEAVAIQTGDVCQASGLYQSSGPCGHSMQLIVPRGHRFPACSNCRGALTWSLIAPS